MSNGVVKFAVGGAVQAKAGTYLPRPADDELLTACKVGEFAYVLACRQIGKSSLMNETAVRLLEENYRTARIDLNTIGKNVIKADDWYFNFLDILAEHLNLDVDVERWWEARPRLTVTRRFLQFLREVVLAQIPEPVVVFVDEIDMMLGLTFADDFFAAIRTVYNDRAQNSAYQRLTFVLLGVAAPDDLIRDETRTPFNIGKGIALPDFTKAECEPFRQEIVLKYPGLGTAYFDEIYTWTHGHPYLIQKLCDALLKAVGENGPDLVNNLVNQLFLSPESRGDDNLQFVQSRVKDDAHATAMLRAYKSVLNPEEIVLDDDQSMAINRLKLYGLVVVQNNQLTVRNRLYAEVFNTVWADDLLRRIRLGLPGDYTILHKMRQGDLSTIYLAETHNTDEKQLVTLRAVNLQQESDEEWAKWIAWLEQDSPRISELVHPNIIRAHEADYNIDDKTLFIATEYVPGETLQERLKTGGPLLRTQVVGMMRQLGDALSYAHAQGMVHLGVNPRNILFDSQEEQIRPVLISFGQAKLLPTDEHILLHRPSAKLARQYMAPEQLQEAETLTPAADIYGLAVTFFEVLSGQLPPMRQTGESLPALSQVSPETGNMFDDVLLKATEIDPVRRFSNVVDFVSTLETINKQVEEAQRIEQEAQAAQAIEFAQNYIQKDRYDPDKVLSMIEMALEMYPGYIAALRLRGKVWLDQDQIDKALEDYRQAYEQIQAPSSEIGLEYLDVLSQVAELHWQNQNRQEAIQYYETILQILDGQGHKNEPAQEIGQQARARLVEHYLYQGRALKPAAGSVIEFDEAITILGQHIAVLEALGANHESMALQEKLSQLRIKKYKHILNAAQAEIEKITPSEKGQVPLDNEEVFQYYASMDDAFQKLIEFAPELEHWQEIRYKKLQEWGNRHHSCAERALKKPDPHYEAALRHFKAILDIEQSRYPGLAQELGLDLNQEITQLKQKADHDGKYRAVRKLMDEGDYIKALEHLDRDFICERNFEHRDVAKLLWGSVFAKRHHGQLPPEWEVMAIHNALNTRLENIERERLQQLEAQLGPWSQEKILETISQESKMLGDFEEPLNGVASMLNQAVNYGVAGQPEVEKCRFELAEARTQIQKQRDAIFQIDVNETAQQADAWLREIDEIRGILGNQDGPIGDIPEFFNRSEKKQEEVKQHPTFARLQALISDNATIGRRIERVKLRTRRRLLQVLIDDIGLRDDEIVAVRKEGATAKDKLTQAQDELDKARKQLTTLQSVQEKLDKLNRLRAINKWGIPIFLGLAILIGMFFAPAVGLSAVAGIAWVLIIGYLIYYIWTYYIS